MLLVIPLGFPKANSAWKAHCLSYGANLHLNFGKRINLWYMEGVQSFQNEKQIFLVNGDCSL